MTNNIKDIFRQAETFLVDVTIKIEEAVQGIDTISARELLKYALSQKGQMLRPSLIYTTAYALNPNLDSNEYIKLVYYACAIELLHTASLVHDDIIDATIERRGKKSIFSLYGSNNAVLTGNIFYLTAFDITNKHLEKPQIESIIRAALDMCCGEVIQLSYKDKAIPHEVYFEITGKKTASLIKYAFKESGRIAGISEAELLNIQKLGDCLGILYQLYDDYKDKDVYLEPGFDFKFYASKYLSLAADIVGVFEENLHKKTFEALVNFYKQIFESANMKM